MGLSADSNVYPQDMEQIAEICSSYTDLSAEDIEIITDVAMHIGMISELTGSDIFIDVLSRNDVDSVVLAWASPGPHSLYRKSVVREYAFAISEPAVYRTMKTGEASRNIRGISQEGIPIAQTVVPIRNRIGAVIGVLIMERNITTEVQEERQVEFLSQTAEQLSNTLMHLSMTESSFKDWIGNGIFVLNAQGKITYANFEAAEVYRHRLEAEPLGNDFTLLFPECKSIDFLFKYLQTPVEMRVDKKVYQLHGHNLINYGKPSGCVVSVQDVTDLRMKEQELNMKSTIISEIHHRVKNNLQNIAALLRMQARRTDSEFIRSEFTSSINRIISIALAYEIFAREPMESIDLLEMVRGIMESLRDSMGDVNGCFCWELEGDAVRVSHSQAVPLALIINELVTNSIKHAISKRVEGTIRIKVAATSRRVMFYIADNGLAELSPDVLHGRKSLGLDIVRKLVADQLEGHFTLARKNRTTYAVVSFPPDSAL